LPSEQIDLAGKPYRYRHGWILLNPGIGTGRMHMRGLENAAEKAAGVTKPPLRPPSAKMKSLGKARFRSAAEMDNAQAVRGRQHMRGLENTEIANLHAISQASRTRTNRLVTKGFGDANARHSGNIGQVADKVTASLRGKRASDYQHLTAAKLHTAAARYQARTPAEKTHHLQMAAMHRGIAARTPGRGTRSRPARSKPAPGTTKGTSIPGGVGRDSAGRQVGSRNGVTQRTMPSFTQPSPAPAKPGGKAPTGKASETAAGRRAALKSGHALPPARPGGPPGFPVTDAKHWQKAFEAVGRAGSPARRAALKALLLKTASEFGKTSKIKGSWLAASNTGPALEFASWEHELRGKGGKWASTVGGRGLPDDKPPAHSMTVDQLRSHLENYHSGAPSPPALRGTSRTARGKAALVTQHERMHAMLAAPRGQGNQLVEPGIGHSHGMNLSNAMEFAMPTIQPVSSPGDIIVSRGEDGNVIIRHRNGGAEIGTMTRTEQGGWVATVGGRALAPRNHQRTALADIIGTHNKGALTDRHRPASAGEPLQPAPRQTQLMQQFGIPAVRALATPTMGSSDGPRATSNGSDSDDKGSNGLGPKGQAIYKKLKARGFPDARAMAFAKRAENMGGGK
jgi:hypothetical protein